MDSRWRENGRDTCSKRRHNKLISKSETVFISQSFTYDYHLKNVEARGFGVLGY